MRKRPAASRNFGDDEKKRLAQDNAGVYGKHAYAVADVDPEGWTVDLENPWGYDHAEGLSLEDFRRFYRELQIGD